MEIEKLEKLAAKVYDYAHICSSGEEEMPGYRCVGCPYNLDGGGCCYDWALEDTMTLSKMTIRLCKDLTELMEELRGSEKVNP